MKIGLFLRYLSDDYQISIYQGILDRTQARGIDLVCYQGDGVRLGQEGGPNPFGFASRLNLDGLLILSQVAFDTNRSLSRRRLDPWLPPIPVVSVGARIPGLVSLTIEARESMRRLLDHLIVDHGYRRLLFLGGFPHQTDSRIRERVFRETIRDHRRTRPGLRAVVDYGAFSEAGALEAMARQRENGPFDAVVAANDYMAIGVKKFLRTQPDPRWQACAVTGFDDIPQASQENPPLTSVRQPLFELGLEAVDCLVRILQGDPVPPVKSIPSILCLRESCGCPRTDTEASSDTESRVLADRLEKVQRLSFEHEQFIRHGADLAREMGAAIDLPSVLASLDRFLPHFAVRSLWLFVFPGREEAWLPARVSLAYRWDGGAGRPLRPDTDASEGDLGEFWEQWSRQLRRPLSLCMAHLIASAEPLGLIVYDLEPWAHPHLILGLWHLTNALKRLRTLAEQADRAQRLEAMVEARTRDLVQVNDRLREEIALRSATEGEVLRISEFERRRLGLDLHDDICQRMVGISLYVRGLQRNQMPPALKDHLSEIGSMVEETLSRTRQYAYTNFPVELERQGLDSVLRSLCNTLGLQNGCRIRYSSELADLSPPFDPHQALNLYRIVQEALQNAVKHSGATVIEVAVEVEAARCLLQITDNGRGLSGVESDTAGLGLRSMAYRAEQLSGVLDLSTKPGYGTVVRVEIPR